MSKNNSIRPLDLTVIVNGETSSVTFGPVTVSLVEKIPLRFAGRELTATIGIEPNFVDRTPGDELCYARLDFDNSLPVSCESGDVFFCPVPPHTVAGWKALSVAKYLHELIVMGRIPEPQDGCWSYDHCESLFVNQSRQPGSSVSAATDNEQE
ncbi:hypothetical protein HZV21_005101 [Salmonella enterica]|nr:hypothetical protein [Salmonella enterica]EJI6541015.1 hypothetical protein [Salmonella enterica]EJK5562029.1 hypothetical protein [Salmonella enterica]HCA3583980.1 hypothetical protein [Salmonella enterica subsp. enterica serovar Java]